MFLNYPEQKHVFVDVEYLNLDIACGINGGTETVEIIHIARSISLFPYQWHVVLVKDFIHTKGQQKLTNTTKPEKKKNVFTFKV